MADRTSSVLTYRRGLIAGALYTCGVWVLALGAITGTAHYVDQARYGRANAIVTCVGQLRFAESVPEEIWNADDQDTFSVELAYCRRFVDGS